MSVMDQGVGFEQPRLVTKKILAIAQNEGDGAVVRRSIGRYQNLQSIKFLIQFFASNFIVDFHDFDFILLRIYGLINTFDLVLLS